MKKIIIIFIIAFCLISFMEISFLAQEPLKLGEAWNEIMSDYEKAFYLKGFRDGIINCLVELAPLMTSPDSDLGIALYELLLLYDFIWEHQEAVITVMDDLYKDPANIYIKYPSMCEIACQKLKGEDVEQLLKEARKEGYLHPLKAYQEYKKKIEK